MIDCIMVCPQHSGQSVHDRDPLLGGAPAGLREHSRKFSRIWGTFRVELPGTTLHSIPVYMFMCVCVCVCVSALYRVCMLVRGMCACVRLYAHMWVCLLAIMHVWRIFVCV